MAIEKKKILISPELQQTPVGNFFQASGLECHTEFNPEYKEDYCFIVNDCCPEIDDLPRVKLDAFKTYDPAIEKNIRGIFDPSYLDNLQVQRLLELFFVSDEFNLVDTFSKEFKNVKSIKIHDYLNVGYFIDSIVIDGYQNEFDYDLLRKYLNQVFEYSWSEMEIKEESVIEVSYSFTKNVFALEFSFPKENFSLKDSFSSESVLLKKFGDNTNFFNVNYFSKRNKVTLSSLWFSNDKLKNFKSYFFSEISSKSISTGFSNPLILGLEEKENVEYRPKELRENLQAKKLSQARNFAIFIKNYRKDEAEPKDLMSLDLADISDYLTHYPRQEVVLGMDDEAKSFVLKLVQDEKLFNGITEYCHKEASSNLGPQLAQIQRVLSGKSLADLNEIIRVKGVTANFTDETAIVKGWVKRGAGEGNAEEATVEDVTDSISNNEKWEKKRSALGKKIEEELVKMNLEGRSILQEDIIRVVSKEVDVEDLNVAIVVREIIEEALSNELAQGGKLEDSFALKFIARQANASEVSEKSVEQVTRMKKVMEAMRAEIVKLRSEADVSIKEEDAALVTAQAAELSKLKKALTTTLEIMKNKEKIIAKRQTDFDQIIEAKDAKARTLEAKIEELKVEYTKTREFATVEKIEQVQVENKNLNSRLELATRKINIMNENMEKQDNSLIIKKDREITSLKTNLQAAQAQSDKFKKERSDLENKLNEEKEKHAQLLEKVDPSTTDAIKEELEKEKQLLAATNAEKKILEDKLRAQGVELKKQEQKLRLTSAQLEGSLRKMAAPVANKSNDVFAKQLENASARINETTAELTERKKEVIKLKQDNTLLTGKVAELEKKLSNLEKKAA